MRKFIILALSAALLSFAAAAFAALEKDRDHLVSVLGKEASITVLLTGTGFKDMKAFDGAVSLPESIENSVEAVKALPF